MNLELGYQLSSEEHPAPDLVGYARRAEEVGFSYAVVSDHLPPLDAQAGPGAVRLDGARRDRAGDETPAARDGRHDADPAGAALPRRPNSRDRGDPAAGP